ncbi:predicted protein [Sclerotinia sclerotiorum 1980 UF-70]|uniref:Uncharacterized protein n=1 Tax=Sclerotinia sclerotiorum (strain ATCC 18683 / 1980 / Ss-1) TaxID=665079 RepID=A7EL46_SCLS1|nr:predicted protein [Sclerotinia sclerotiorum 1980 UF-70]EDO03562.1 predicted protein [Sclerotinia sclerotiorum 1980 UF-70]
MTDSTGKNALATSEEVKHPLAVWIHGKTIEYPMGSWKTWEIWICAWGMSLERPEQSGWMISVGMFARRTSKTSWAALKGDPQYTRTGVRAKMNENGKKRRVRPRWGRLGTYAFQW